MQHKHAISLLLIFLPLTLFHCGPVQEYAVKVENPIYNFGQADEGTTIEFAYVIKNTGKQPVIIEDVRPDCGCTVTGTWDKEIPSGKTGKIPVSFKTQGYNGEISKSITVRTNIPASEPLRLTVTGTVFTPVTINPRNAHLGEVAQQKTGSLQGSFEITNNMQTPLKIVEVIPPDTNTQIRSLETITDGVKYKLDITVTPDCQAEGIKHFSITLKTDHKKYTYFYPGFSYYCVPPVQVYPLKLIVLNQGEGGELFINVRSHIDKPIRVRDVKLHGTQGVQYRVNELEKDKLYQIAVIIPQGFVFPEDQVITFSFRVSNDPKNIVYTVPIENYQPR